LRVASQTLNDSNQSTPLDSRNQLMHPNILRAAILAATFAILTSPANAVVSYTATLLDSNFDFQQSFAAGASNSAQAGYGYSPDFTGGFHAFKWSGTAASFVDLNPSNFTTTTALASADTVVLGVPGTAQVGDGFGPIVTGNNNHALVWRGTAASLVDLTPTGFDVAYGKGVASANNAFGSTQVGYGSGSTTTGDANHAFLWSGTAASRVDLHPASGYTESFALAVAGSVQVGYGTTPSEDDHALLWTGSAGSKVDLNPSGFTQSHANGVYVNGGNTKTVGDGTGSATGGNQHALLWNDQTAASRVDLNPSGFTTSKANAISSAGQVGMGQGSDGKYHALYWNGLTDFIDLHADVSDDVGVSFNESYALGIADNGDIVGYGVDDGGFEHALLWKLDSTTPPDSGVNGDYNNNGKVDAGDYIAWRKGNNPLHNEVATIGSNTPADYTEWRARFGNPPGSGTSFSSAAIPEPTSCTLLAAALAAFARRTRR
jgi:hypothetical protein